MLTGSPYEHRVIRKTRRLGGELAGSLQRIAGPHPESFKPPQGHDDALQIIVGDRGLAQHSTWLRCIAANLGSALNPLLEGTAGGDPAAGRVPAGNLLNRLVGIALVLALVNRIGPLMVSIEADAGRVVADFHTVFNLVMAILFLPLLRPFTRMLVWLLPARAASTDPSQPIYLSEAAREPPCPCGCGTGGAPHG